MVRDHEEVERAGELGAQAAGRKHLLAAGEAVGLLLPQPVQRAGIDGDVGVEMRVAEQGPRRIAPPGIGRELRLDDGIDVLLGDRLVIVRLLGGGE